MYDLAVTVTPRTRAIIWGKAGATCAYAECRAQLVTERAADSDVLLGEIAHIVAQQSEGPRGGKHPPGGDVDGEQNLLLLCPTHHKLIDKDTAKFTVERLVQIKLDHEQWVRETLSSQVNAGGGVDEPLVTDTLHSTLLPVIGYPRHVFGTPCNCAEREVREQIVPPASRQTMLPYIVRSRQLFSFVNLRERSNPFQRVIDCGAVERHDSTEWWDNDDLRAWYVTLLNRSLNKLTGRRGLRLDKDHARYYFEPDTDLSPRSVTYTTLTGQVRPRMVAWRPKLKHSGEFRKYWEHFAVGLRFHRMGQAAWVLSIRPERRFTKDGYEPLTPKGTGKRSTSRKSRMYNEQVLREVNFWRDFLSDGRPRIVLDFGEQRLMIDTTLIGGDVEWPGVPHDARAFTHTTFEEDLFTRVELDQLVDEEETE